MAQADPGQNPVLLLPGVEGADVILLQNQMTQLGIYQGPNAIRDLTRVYDTVVQLSPMLAHAAQDPDPGVQATAQWALSQLNRLPSAPAMPTESTVLESTYDSDRLPPS